MTQTHPSLAPQGHAERDEALGEPQGAPGPGGRHGGEPFGKNAAATGAIAAKPLADAQLETHAIVGPRQIGQGPGVLAVDTPCWCGTQRTRHARLRRTHQERDLRRGGVDIAGGKAQRGGIG